MKKLFSIIAVISMFVFGTLFLTACEEPTPQPEENKVTVGWYYGSKLLKEEEVEKGTVLESWTPVQEGKTLKANNATSKKLESITAADAGVEVAKMPSEIVELLKKEI